ncbi:MAG TPA: hypothetical protein VHD87_14895 [Acidimicrobiales bacterium]|nr:hypothetical protein [Acidimicrobiales bacterium]
MTTSRNLWHLELQTFGGIVAGASHYMANLVSNDNRKIVIEWQIDQHTAHRWNRIEKAKWSGALAYEYKAGSASNRFNSREDAISAAVAAFGHIATPPDVLVKGNPAASGPHRPMAGDAAIIVDMAALFAQAEAVGWWDGSERDEMYRISNEWDDLIKRHNFIKASYSIDRTSEMILLTRERGEWTVVEHLDNY